MPKLSTMLATWERVRFWFSDHVQLVQDELESVYLIEKAWNEALQKTRLEESKSAISLSLAPWKYDDLSQAPNITSVGQYYKPRKQVETHKPLYLLASGEYFDAIEKLFAYLKTGRKHGVMHDDKVYLLAFFASQAQMFALSDTTKVLQKDLEQLCTFVEQLYPEAMPRGGMLKTESMENYPAFFEDLRRILSQMKKVVDEGVRRADVKDSLKKKIKHHGKMESNLNTIMGYIITDGACPEDLGLMRCFPSTKAGRDDLLGTRRGLLSAISNFGAEVVEDKMKIRKIACGEFGYNDDAYRDYKLPDFFYGPVCDHVNDWKLFLKGETSYDQLEVSDNSWWAWLKSCVMRWRPKPNIKLTLGYSDDLTIEILDQFVELADMRELRRKFKKSFKGILELGEFEGNHFVFTVLPTYVREIWAASAEMDRIIGITLGELSVAIENLPGYQTVVRDTERLSVSNYVRGKLAGDAFVMASDENQREKEHFATLFEETSMVFEEQAICEISGALACLEKEEKIIKQVNTVLGNAGSSVEMKVTKKDTLVNMLKTLLDSTEEKKSEKERAIHNNNNVGRQALLGHEEENKHDNDNMLETKEDEKISDKDASAIENFKNEGFQKIANEIRETYQEKMLAFNEIQRDKKERVRRAKIEEGIDRIKGLLDEKDSEIRERLRRVLADQKIEWMKRKAFDDVSIIDERRDQLEAEGRRDNLSQQRAVPEVNTDTIKTYVESFFNYFEQMGERNFFASNAVKETFFENTPKKTTTLGPYSNRRYTYVRGMQRRLGADFITRNMVQLNTSKFLGLRLAKKSVEANLSVMRVKIHDELKAIKAKKPRIPGVTKNYFKIWEDCFEKLLLKIAALEIEMNRDEKSVNDSFNRIDNLYKEGRGFDGIIEELKELALRPYGDVAGVLAEVMLSKNESVSKEKLDLVVAQSKTKHGVIVARCVIACLPEAHNDEANSSIRDLLACSFERSSQGKITGASILDAIIAEAKTEEVQLHHLLDEKKDNEIGGADRDYGSGQDGTTEDERQSYREAQKRGAARLAYRLGQIYLQKQKEDEHKIGVKYMEDAEILGGHKMARQCLKRITEEEKEALQRKNVSGQQNSSSFDYTQNRYSFLRKKNPFLGFNSAVVEQKRKEEAVVVGGVIIRGKSNV